MKIFSPVIFFATIFIFSCSSKDKKPADLLSVDKMQKIMWDMVKADQYVTDFVSKDSTKNKDTELVKLYDAIFVIHKTSRAQFKKSIDYYSKSPELMQPIMDSMSRKQREVFQPRVLKKDSLIKTIKPHPAE